jgi:ABC-type sugar transport system ATPase subunit
MDLYKAPANTFVAQFLGSPKINLLPYTMDASHNRIQFDSQTSLACADVGLSTTQALRGALLGVRPEDIRLGEPGTGLNGVIEFTEQLGDSTIVYVRLPWHPDLVTAKLKQQQITHRMGETICLHLDPAQVHLIDAQNTRLLPI